MEMLFGQDHLVLLKDIDLSRLYSGAYFVKIISKEGIGVKKFIKM